MSKIHKGFHLESRGVGENGKTIWIEVKDEVVDKNVAPPCPDNFREGDGTQKQSRFRFSFLKYANTHAAHIEEGLERLEGGSTETKDE